MSGARKAGVKRTRGRSSAVVSRPSSSSTRTDTAYNHPFDQVVVGRRRQQRLDITLAHGSITEADARACALGLFRDVTPTGPAAALDARLDGAIAEIVARRMFNANVGEIFVLPTGRHALRTELIFFAGLGSFDRFDDSVQQLVAENVIRTCIRTRIDTLAAVLFGVGSGRGLEASLRNELAGFFRGLQGTEGSHHFRSLILCELDGSRYAAMKRELYRLSSTSLFDDVEVTIDEQVLPVPVPTRQAAAPTVRPIRLEAPDGEPMYLVVRQERSSRQAFELSASLLTTAAKATVMTGVATVRRQALDRLLGRIDAGRLKAGVLGNFADDLVRLVLTPDIAKALHEFRRHHLVLVHDATASRIPWETIRVRGWYPAAERGMSRRYLADNLSIAKWLESRRQAESLSILLVANPTEDLPGAEAEGDRLRQLFASSSSIRTTELRGPDATEPNLLEAFHSGTYDVIHYAGHAFFDAESPSRSGIWCHGDRVLRGSELAGLSHLPSLVFFNACESGRLRRRTVRWNRDPRDIRERIERSVGFAEAFLRGGISNYVGTYWVVGDSSALTFAKTFYPSLLRGISIGRALLEARSAVRKLGTADWADYVHYGSPGFSLKQTRR